jgi:energy-coupling factor transporter ATP-binding protein EcfA2
MTATILGMSRRQIDAAFDEIVAFAGIEEFIDSPVKIYSSGMYIRLGFSVAVHVDPEILIVDEVIAVGDAEFQRKCFDHLYNLRKKGVTIVVVTHGLDTVESMCDGAAWLDHGELQLVGTGPEVAAAYMGRVNAEERAERDRIVAAGAQDLAAGVTGEATERIEDVSVTGVQFLDGDRRDAGVGVYGETLVIRIHYDAIRPVSSPVFGVALYSTSDVHVTGTNTKIGGMRTPEISGKGHIDFEIPALPVTAGDYELTVAVSDEFVQHNFDRREREWRLPVRHGGHLEPEGVVDLRGTWTMGDGSAR